MDEPTQDEPFLDAVEASVRDALARVGDDPSARLAFFKRLLAVAQDAVSNLECRGSGPVTNPARTT